MATTESRTSLPSRLAVPAFVGGLVALAGTYWDDAWHTDRGRDDFFIAPHLTLYGGILVAAVVVVMWLAQAARDRGVLGALHEDRQLRWAFAAVVAVFASAPLDNMWHSAYGRDAVLFSPPHLLAIVASASLVIALAGGLEDPADHRAIGLMAGTGVLGSLLVPVMEYEADVPQFSPAWSLPVVTVAVVIARPVAARLLPGRWPLTKVAATYTVLRLAFVVGLAAAGFSTPIVPPVLVAAAVADLAARRWPRPAQAGAVVAAVHLAYVPWLAVVPHGVPVTGRHLATSVTVALVGALTADAAIRPVRRLPRVPVAGAAATALVLLVLVATSPPASAHDPGQGELRGRAQLSATVDDRTVRLDATLDGIECAGFSDATLVARRAGMARSTPLSHQQGCTYEGRVTVPDSGRWFVYATFLTDDATLETWLPLEVADGTRTTETHDVYEPPHAPNRATEAWFGAILVLIAAGLLLGTLRSVAGYESAR